jgi:hypothetical protein
MSHTTTIGPASFGAPGQHDLGGRPTAGEKR